MSFHVACDLSTCGAKAHLPIREGEQVLPHGWHAFQLDDFCYHGCSREHLEGALTEDGVTHTRAMPVLGPQEFFQPEDGRTPSDRWETLGRAKGPDQS